MKLEYNVELDNIEVKEYILYLGLGQNFNKKVKLYGKIFINDVLSKNYFVLHKGDKLTLEVSEKANEDILANDNELDIRYVDEYMMILNKPYNLSSQPSRKHFEDNVISRVMGYLKRNNIETNVHLVNRLDYQTSGLMVVSLNGTIHHLLTDNVDRYYLCVCEGKVEGIKEVKIKIDRLEDNNILRCVSDSGKEAITIVEGIKYDGESDVSLVKCTLLTGRTHQIRLTLSYLNHPLIGDKLYNPRYLNKENVRLMLHSYKVNLTHPITKKEIEYIDIADFLSETSFKEEEIKCLI